MVRTTLAALSFTALSLAAAAGFFVGQSSAAPLPGVLPGISAPTTNQPVTQPPQVTPPPTEPMTPPPVEPPPLTTPPDEGTGAGDDPDGTPTVMFGNVAAIGTFIANRGDSGVIVTRVETTDLSARWYILPASGDKAMICNVQDPLLCLVDDNGTVALGNVDANDTSGQWIANGLSADRLRIRSVDHPNLFLSRRETLDLELAQDDDDNPAQQWWLQQ